MTRVLVTGASGYVGRAILAALAKSGFEVHGVARNPPHVSDCRWSVANLLDSAEAAKVVDEARATHLLHLAWTTGHGRFWNDPDNARWRDATLHLLRTFAQTGGRRFVMAGSCAEYDWTTSEPLSEKRTALRPQTLYGKSKAETFLAAEAASRAAGVSFANARLFFSYGPFEHPQRLVPSIVRKLIAGEPAHLVAGALVRDVMDVRDVGMCLAALLTSEVEGAVNICSGSGVSLAHVAELIAALAGRPELVDVQANASSSGEAASLVGENDRLLREVGVAPEIGLEDGLAHAIDWWRAKLQAG